MKLTASFFGFEKKNILDIKKQEYNRMFLPEKVLSSITIKLVWYRYRWVFNDKKVKTKSNLKNIITPIFHYIWTKNLVCECVRVNE